MKKIILLLLLVLSFTLSSFSQTEDNQTEDRKSESLTVAFMDKYGKLLEETRYEVGKVSGIKFDVIILKNILDGTKIGSLRLTTSTTTRKYYGYLDFDEIDNCIQTLQYIKENVPAELDKGCFFKEVAYRTRDYVKLGICYDEWPHDSWQPYIMTHSYDKDSKETFKSKDIEKIISIFNQSKEMIKEKTK